MLRHKPGNFDYALDPADSMADSDSDLETDGLELALDTLCIRHCSEVSNIKSKSYCSEFCQVSLTPLCFLFCSVTLCLLLTKLAPLANVSLRKEEAL